MSSSFTDQPSPHDPQPEAGYTPTPPAPSRRTDAADDRDAGLPKLGSLAQKARGKQLKQARGILLVIGILTILWNGASLVMIPHLVDESINKEVIKQGGFQQVDPVLVQQARNEQLAINYAITGLFLVMGVLFVIFGMLVYRFPLAMTITSLVLYLLATMVMIMNAALSEQPGAVAGAVGGWFFIRILIIIALVKSIQSAYAYEKERRAEEEYGLSA